MDITKTRCFKESKIIAEKMNAKEGHVKIDSLKNWVVWLGEQENLSIDNVQKIFDYFIWNAGYTTRTY